MRYKSSQEDTHQPVFIFKFLSSRFQCFMRFLQSTVFLRLLHFKRALGHIF